MNYEKLQTEWGKKRLKMAAMRNRDKSVREIANTLDVSVQRVYVVLKEMGFTFPKRGAK